MNTTQVVAYRFPAFKKFKLYWCGSGQWDTDKGAAQKFTNYQSAKRTITAYYGTKVYTIFVEELEEI